jgi:Protein of unknown function (DUF1236)
MNNSKLMIAVATAALLAGTSAVFAQQPGGAPAGQMAPRSPGGQATGQPATPGAMHDGAAETKGGENATEERREQTKPNRTGEAQPNRNRETTGQAPQNERQENRTEGNKATNGATEERHLDQNRATEERGRDNERKDQNRATEERGRDGARNRTTTGQGAAPNKGNVSVNITPEKRTQMHQVFTQERSAPRVDRVDFDLAVGTAVPRSVHFVSVPSTIVAIEPSWRGYDYFMVGEQIVIVDPRSLEIVAIIDA